MSSLPLVRWYAALFAVIASFAPAVAAPLRITNSRSGVWAEVDPASGRYAVGSSLLAESFAGSIGTRVDADSITHGADVLGDYREIHVGWRQDGNAFSGAIRVYDADPIVLFRLGAVAGSEHGLPAFPDFRQVPAGLNHFSFRNDNFAPPSFTLEETSTPWLLFDAKADAAIISPAANFMVARMSSAQGVGSGLNPELQRLPAGFTHETFVVFGRGINAAWDTFGKALRLRAHRPAVPNDADIGLRYLGYWTDNGAAYYYHYDPALGYADTLLKLVARYREERIPIRYLQLDSWWYYKSFTDPDGKQGTTKVPEYPHEEWNRYGGLMKYEAHPGLFPQGLATFRRQVGLPLITHNRWVDPKSPYHEHYKFVGLAGVDPAWWQHIMDYLAASGVVCYEQDWLDRIEKYSPALRGDPASWHGFMAGMADAARRDKLSVQYCMPEPRHYLQGASFPNVTTTRTSGDRLDREKWDWFLYTSRLAACAGIWPWTDVFMSTEQDNLLIATLSGGMVGIGDELGKEDAANLRHVARADGMLVKTDAPLLPIDDVYLADATKTSRPMVASTYTDHDGRRTVYVFAYDRSHAGADAAFTPAAFGVSGKVLVYDGRSGSARRIDGAQPFTFKIAKNDWSFLVFTPIEPSGLSFVGDADKWVADGRKRIAAIKATPSGLDVTVTFAAGEWGVRLFGFADKSPRVKARRGAVSSVDFDPATGRYEFTVSPTHAVTEEAAGGDPIQQAVVEISAAGT